MHLIVYVVCILLYLYYLLYVFAFLRSFFRSLFLPFFLTFLQFLQYMSLWEVRKGKTKQIIVLPSDI